MYIVGKFDLHFINNVLKRMHANYPLLVYAGNLGKVGHAKDRAIINTKLVKLLLNLKQDQLMPNDIFNLGST